jgi:hypothetical protein
MDAAEGWKRKLARELKAAGFQFDPAKVWACISSSLPFGGGISI